MVSGKRSRIGSTKSCISTHVGSREPAVVLLPDGKLFTVMRNMTGYIYYSVSADYGKTWDIPKMLKYSDKGEGIKHPMSPCPLYKMGNGQLLLLFHNNNGKRIRI